MYSSWIVPAHAMLTLPLDHIRFQPSAMAGMGGGRTGRVKLPERKLGASLWFELLLKKRKVSARAQGMAAHSACTYRWHVTPRIWRLVRPIAV